MSTKALKVALTAAYILASNYLALILSSVIAIRDSHLLTFVTVHLVIVMLFIQCGLVYSVLSLLFKD